MQRIDDRKYDAYDRRRYSAWCGLYRDRHGAHWQRTLWWHPAFWWDIFRPGSPWRGMRRRAVRSFWKARKAPIYAGRGGV